MFSKAKGFDATKLKATLRLCNSRFDVAKNKKTALMKQNMREVALLLAEEPPKEEKAKIRTERLIKDDYLIEAYEILQLECQLLAERVPLIKHSTECPSDLVPCVSDLIYAAPRVEIQELQEIKRQLVAKFGKKFGTDADNNEGGIISQRIVEKLSVAPPTAYLVQTYMAKIAKLHEVEYEPTAQLTLQEAFEPIAAPVGYSVPVATGTGLGPMEKKPRSIRTECVPQETPDRPSAPPSNPSFKGTAVQAYAYTEEDIFVPDITAEPATAPTASEEKPDADSLAEASAPPAPEENHDTDAHLKKVTPSAPTPTTTESDSDSQLKETRSVPTAQSITASAPEENKEHCSVMSGLRADGIKEQEAQKEEGSRSVPSEDNYDFVEIADEETDQAEAGDMQQYSVLTGLSVPSNKANADVKDPIMERGEYTGMDEVAKEKEAQVTFVIPDTEPKSSEFESEPTILLTEQKKEAVEAPAPSQLDILRSRFLALGGDVAPKAEDKSRDFCATVEYGAEAASDIEDRFAVTPRDDCCAEETDPVPVATEELLETNVPDEIISPIDDQAKVLVCENGTEKEDEQERIESRDASLGKITPEDGDRTSPAPVDDKSTTKDRNASIAEHITGAALAGGAVGFAVAGSLGGLLGAAAVAHLAANKKGKAADMARTCGKKVTKMTNKLVDKMERA